MHTQTHKKSSAGDNLGFEIMAADLPANWIFYQPEFCPYIISTDTSIFKEGKQSLRFDIQSCDANSRVDFTGFTNEFMKSTQGGCKYRVSFWIINKGPSLRIYLNGVSAKQAGKNPVIIEDQNPHPEWYLHQSEIMVPEDMWLRFEMQVRGEGSCWIDDVQIEKVD